MKKKKYDIVKYVKIHALAKNKFTIGNLFSCKIVMNSETIKLLF